MIENLPEYSPVQLQGQFMEQFISKTSLKEMNASSSSVRDFVLIGPRSLNQDALKLMAGERRSGLARMNAPSSTPPGYHVIQPFKL